MRRPVFDRWIKREVLRVSGARVFNLRHLAAQAQSTTPELAAPLLLHAYVTGSLQRLMDYVYRDDVRADFERVATILSGRNVAMLALRKKPPAPLPARYADVLAAYRAAYYRPEAEAAEKRDRWTRITQLQAQKGIGNAEVYRALDLDPGNTNAFLKHGTASRVSLAATADILHYLESL